MDTSCQSTRTRIAHGALIVLGILIAIPVGAALGFFLVLFGGQLLFGPEFIQSGWIFAMYTVPAGAVLAGVLGGRMMTQRPQLYAWTILPLAVFLLGLAITLITLHGMVRPRNFVLELKGTPGAEFFGIVSVDGQAQALQGTLPARLEFTAMRIDSAFALANTHQLHDIAVEIFADGSDLSTGGVSQTGIVQHLQSSGYSETFGGTSNSWHRMSRAEVAQLIQDNQMPAGPNFR